MLDRYWHLLDKDGNLHIVLYNQDLDKLAIVAWWTTLRDFYQVSLTHYGKSVFFLTIFKSSSHPKSFPRWHSLYHQVPNSVTFNVLLTQHKITCSSLVSNFSKLLASKSLSPKVLNFIYFSHNIILNIRTFQAPCIIFLKTKAGLIWIWKTLHNARLCSITWGKQLKLEPDGNIFVKLSPSKLTWKLFSNSLIQ